MNADLRGLVQKWREQQRICQSHFEQNDYGKCADELEAALSVAQGQGWRSAKEPPNSALHTWSEPVAAITWSGDVFRISYMHGSEPGEGCWQRTHGMAELGPVGEVAAWIALPSIARAAAPAQPDGVE